MEKVSDTIKNFINFIEAIPSEYEKCVTMDNQILKKINDLEHTLELDKTLKYHDYARLGKEIGDVRGKRREFKDRGITIAPIVEFLSKNKNIINTLSELYNEICETETMLENRTYNERCSIDTNELLDVSDNLLESTNTDENKDYLKIKLSNIISNQTKYFEINDSDTFNEFNVTIKHSKLSKSICEDVIKGIASQLQNKVFTKNYINATYADKIHIDSDGKKYLLCQIHVYKTGEKDHEWIINVRNVERNV